MSYPEPAIRLAKPDIGPEEIEAVSRVLTSSVLTNGPETALFERSFAEYHSVEHAVAFSNGTLALMAMYVALGIGVGDEVIVPSLTFVSSATSVSLVGATPVFADVDPLTFNLDPVDVEKRLSSRTKAILAVHYGGQPADMDGLRSVAEAAGVILLEDAAEAHGAIYRGVPVGGLGRAAMFSFTPTKNITTGEGGIVTTGDGDLAEKLRLLRNHGQSALYRHETLGWNMRITEMQAAMGSVQLKKLPQILERKRHRVSVLNNLLSDVFGLETPFVADGVEHVYMLYTTKIAAERDRVLHDLRMQGIEARVYFPPVHRQPIYADLRVELPVTDELADRILSLPMHSLLQEDELKQVAEAVQTAVSPVQ